MSDFVFCFLQKSFFTIAFHPSIPSSDPKHIFKPNGHNLRKKQLETPNCHRISKEMNHYGDKGVFQNQPYIGYGKALLSTFNIINPIPPVKFTILHPWGSEEQTGIYNCWLLSEYLRN